MHKKECLRHKLPDGKKNPNCSKYFWVGSNNFLKKDYCDSCQKLRNNEYHKTYNCQWRKKKYEANK